MLTEELISLAEAARLIPTRPHYSTVYRWVTRGVRGVRLDATRVGGHTFTTKAAINRFLAETGGGE